MVFYLAWADEFLRWVVLWSVRMASCRRQLCRVWSGRSKLSVALFSQPVTTLEDLTETSASSSIPPMEVKWLAGVYEDEGKMSVSSFTRKSMIEIIYVYLKWGSSYDHKALFPSVFSGSLALFPSNYYSIILFIWHFTSELICISQYS